ncbi:MAG: hypothetical protein WEA56_03090, partial [Balneolaceae bacterium]
YHRRGEQGARNDDRSPQGKQQEEEMNALEEQLLREAVGDAKPDLCIRSGARIDAGRWWRRTPVWLCIVGGDLVMLAVARRRYIEKVAISDCTASRYSHATGELIIAPAENLRFNRFKLTPREAIPLLARINPGSLGRTLQNQ